MGCATIVGSLPQEQEACPDGHGMCPERHAFKPVAELLTTIGHNHLIDWVAEVRQFFIALDPIPFEWRRTISPALPGHASANVAAHQGHQMMPITVMTMAIAAPAMMRLRIPAALRPESSRAPVPLASTASCCSA